MVLNPPGLVGAFRQLSTMVAREIVQGDFRRFSTRNDTDGDNEHDQGENNQGIYRGEHSMSSSITS